ncbi:hypothetical protein LMH73_022935 [Vibrio splendidus]|nr:hypothetical protein [Vibrio splendidus]MCC4883205.1 hypothetical protein [Vibrio splendidus]
MVNKKERLEDKIVRVLRDSGESSMSDWSLADAIWDNCMQKSQPGNGVRIAHIRRAANNGSLISGYVASFNGAFMVMLNK